MGWSPDGATCCSWMAARHALSDRSERRQPQAVDTGCVPTPSVCLPGLQVAFSPTADDSPSFASPRTPRATRVRGDHDDGPRDRQHRRPELDAARRRRKPGWSPDGSQIVFSRCRRTFRARAWLAIFVIDADGQNMHQVSPTTLAAQDAAWSPDGDSASCPSSPRSDSGGYGDIYTIRPDGTDVRRLTTGGMSAAPSGLLMDGSCSPGRGRGRSRVVADGRRRDQRGSTCLAAEIGVAPESAPGDASGVAAHRRSRDRASTVDTRSGVAARAAGTDARADPHPGPGARLCLDRLTDDRRRQPSRRHDHTARRWPGPGDCGCGTAAELYDPATGTFSPTGSMAAVRAYGTATLLDDGRVLVAGGYNCGVAGKDGIWASAELYDPATGTFSPTGSMAAPRSHHTATLLADGRVLIAGGLSGPSAAGAGSASPRSGPRRSTLPGDGRSLRPGHRDVQQDRFDEHSASRSYRDPSRGRPRPRRGKRRREQPFRYRGRRLRPGDRHVHPDRIDELRSLAPHRDVAGGRPRPHPRWSNAQGLRPRQRRALRPEIRHLHSAGPMEEGRQNHSATLLRDGRVFIAGGYWSDGQNGRILSSTEMYDPATGNFSPVGSMGRPAQRTTAATLLDDGRVLIAGGDDERPRGVGSVPSAVLYQP